MEQWKPLWMATASDKKFSDSRWQANSQILLEPTIEQNVDKNNNIGIKIGN